MRLSLTHAFTKWFAVYLLLLQLLMTGTSLAGSRKRINFQPVYMSSDEVIRYFKSFLSKSSSFDKRNEEYYVMDDFSEDLYHKIDNLMPLPVFIKWLMKTKDITDKSGAKGVSMLYSYQNNLNGKCFSPSAFNQTLHDILLTWDGDRTIISNQLEQWHRDNERAPPSEICNRFRGLTCQYKRAVDPEVDQGKSVEMTNYTTCQCSGDSSVVGFYKTTRARSGSSGNAYPDGCYVRPWKPCKFLSVDTTFKRHYYNQWHGSLENDRQILAQMVFPVGRTHRCKDGTYCLDMVPGMNKPICWCNPNSEDKLCKQAFSSKKIPSAAELSKTRKDFLKLFISANDSSSVCNPEYNDKVLQLMSDAGKDPTRTGAMDVMTYLVSENNIRICDFRQALLCDKKSRTCKGNLNCDPGKIHVGMGVCATNNGFKCQSNEECVENAKCKYFKEASDSACVCEKGYGNQCHLQNAAFFGKRFLPIVSGFQDDEFIKLQVEINHVLESWEDLMKQRSDESCDTSFDSSSMEVAQYFGSLQVYDKDKGSVLLEKARQVIRGGNQLCLYKKFLRCDSITRKCVPFKGKKLLSSTDEAIVVEVEQDAECNIPVPMVFEGIVKFVCQRGFICRKANTIEKCIPDCNSVYAPPKLCPAGINETLVVDESEDKTTTEVQNLQKDDDNEGLGNQSQGSPDSRAKPEPDRESEPQSPVEPEPEPESPIAPVESESEPESPTAPLEPEPEPEAPVAPVESESEPEPPTEPLEPEPEPEAPVVPVEQEPVEPTDVPVDPRASEPESEAEDRSAQSEVESESEAPVEPPPSELEQESEPIVPAAPPEPEPDEEPPSPIEIMADDNSTSTFTPTISPSTTTITSTTTPTSPTSTGSSDNPTDTTSNSTDGSSTSMPGSNETNPSTIQPATPVSPTNEPPPQPPPPPRPQPPPTEPSIGEPCDISVNNCARSTYSFCKAGSGTGGRSTCNCMGSLRFNPTDRICAIPYNLECGSSALMKLNALHNTDLQTPPPCYDSGRCDEVNPKFEACRPKDEEGAIFITQAKAKKLKETGLFYNGGGGSTTEFSSLPIPISLAITFASLRR